MPREFINPPDVHPTTGYQHAVKTGDTVWLAGQVGMRPDGALAGTDIVSQTRQAFENTRRILAAAGATLDDIVQMRVYLTHPAYVPGYVDARAEYLTRIPASTLLIVQSLASPQLLVEVESVAVIDHG